jgi:hypothetical protein
MGVFFNRADALTRSSPAALRLHLAPDRGCLQARILKRRGGAAAAPLSLALSASSGVTTLELKSAASRPSSRSPCEPRY